MSKTVDVKKPKSLKPRLDWSALMMAVALRAQREHKNGVELEQIVSDTYTIVHVNRVSEGPARNLLMKQLRAHIESVLGIRQRQVQAA